MRRRIEVIRRRVGGIPSYFAVVLVVLVLAGLIFSMVATLDMVTVVDHGGGASMTLLTASNQPEEIVKMAGLSTGRHDKVLYTAAENGAASVVIQRAFPVLLEADGEEVALHVTEGTVADMIEEAGVQLGPHDYVEPALDTPLNEGITAQVHRVEFVEETRREAVDPQVVAAYAAALPEGTEFVESTNEEYEVVYRDRLVDGTLESSEMLELIPIYEPLDTRPLDSFTLEAGVPCSRIEGYDDIEVGPDGVPLNYTRVMESAVCTAYSASRGRGSSGLGLYCGTAAVNPNVIPYGTRMYITSADGSFVYGYCIATDTGTAMMEGYVDVDLFFETNAECLQFGKRNMVVYILD